jgi:hypothetical protein
MIVSAIGAFLDDKEKKNFFILSLKTTGLNRYAGIRFNIIKRDSAIGSIIGS